MEENNLIKTEEVAYKQPNLERNKAILSKVAKGIAHMKYRNIFGTLGSFCRKLNDIQFDGHSAVYIPEGEASMMLSAVTGCETAFMTESPPQIVVFNDLMNRLSYEGMFFVVSHELMHFALLHGSRRRGRDPKLFNIVGDKQINQILTKEVLPAIVEQMNKGKGVMDLNRGRALFKTPDDYFAAIGFTPDTANWFTEYEDISEEALYEILRKENYGKKKDEKQAPSKGKGSSGEPTPNEGLEDLDGDPNQSSGGQGSPSQGGGSGQGKGNGSQGQGNPPQGGQGGSQSQGGKKENSGYDNATKEDVDNHLQSGLDIRRKLEEQFGEKGKELADKMSLPRNENEQNIANEKTRVMIQRAKEEARSSNSPVDGYITEAYKMDKDSHAQMQFRVRAHNAARNFAKNASMWVKGEEKTYLSRLSRQEGVRSLLGLKGAFSAKEERRVSPTFNVLWVLDSSGSVMESEFRQNYIPEIREMLTRFDCKMTIVSADTESRGKKIILTPKDVKKLDEEGLEISGGGGTDMLRPLAYELANAEERYHLAIIMSDGGAEAFTKEELEKAMQDEKIKPKSDELPNSLRKARFGGHTIKDKPFVCMVNTRPMYDNSWSSKFGTFGEKEFQMFVLNQGEPTHSVDVDLKGP